MGNCKSKTAPGHVAHAQEYSRTTDELPKGVALDLSANQVAALRAAGFEGASGGGTPSHAGSRNAADGTHAGSPAKDAAGDRKLVFVLGGPGSGKGTQCEKLRERFGFVHLSVGDLLRAEAAKAGSPLGKQLQDIMREGRLVPDDITISILQHAIAQTPPGSVVLLDGFPRSLPQAQQAEEAQGRPLAVLYFDCSEATMRERLLRRAQTSSRADDDEQAIAKRLNTFEQQTLPVRRHYEVCGLLSVADAEPPPDQVFEKVCQLCQMVEELIAAVGTQPSPQPQAHEQPEPSGTIAEEAAAEPADGTAVTAGSSADADANAHAKADAETGAKAETEAATTDQQQAEVAAAADSAGSRPKSEPSHGAANAAKGEHQGMGKEITKEKEKAKEQEKGRAAAMPTDAEAAAAAEPLGSIGGADGTRQQQAVNTVEAEAAAAAGGPPSTHPGAAAAEAPIMANTAAASKSAKAVAARKSLKGTTPAKGGRRSTGPRLSGGPRASGGPQVSGGARSVSPAKRRTSSRAPVAAFPGVSSGGDASSSTGAKAAAAEGQRTADEASLLLGDADKQQADEPEPAAQVALPPLPPAVLLPDQNDDEMMADAKRIAAEAMGLRPPQQDASRPPQGRTRTGSRKAPATAAGKNQPFSWIYGDDEEIAAEAQMLLNPQQHLTGEAAAAKPDT